MKPSPTLFLIAVLATGCAVGPDYRPPATAIPAHYKAESLGSWKEGQPLDHVPKGAWWEIFGDETLNDLQRRASDANQQLRAAVARVDQARATARVVRSELLPALDAEIATVAATVGSRKEEAGLVRSRFTGGIGSDLDVARAETQLATTEAEAASLAQRRTELENAIATLVGENPSTFRLAALGTANGQWHPQPPAIPAGLPSDLLERRPDVAEAERQLAAANARIGVAKAAFFPALRLTGSGGYVSGEIDNLFHWDSRVWSIGPSLSLPIFAGGRNLASYKRSQAAYEEAIARFRQQVLVAFGDIENTLAGIRHLADQSAAQQRAVANARRAADLAGERYHSGIVSYLDVVDADRAAFQAERANVQLAGQRQIAAVQLIKALGGGWRHAELQAALSPATAIRQAR
jgi:multidrug efflux system outer membrane protein